jgi:tripartite-type tricarboxylate transporter receptor subunit TctC
MSSLKSLAHSVADRTSLIKSKFRLVKILYSVLLLTAVTIFQPCIAQVFPARPVSFIVPFAVGSSTDIMTRLLVKGLNERLNTSFFIVEDKPGASGIVGASYVAKAKPDGYTFLVTTGTTHSQNPWLFKQLSYNPMADFDAVAGIGGVPLALLVKYDSPIKTFAELLNFVKTTKTPQSYGTAFGLATICSETIKKSSGIQLTQIPYKSSPQAITELIGGQTLMLCNDLNSSMSAIRGNQVRALAVTIETRSAQLPNVPAITEFMPTFPTMRSWVAVVAPKGTAPEIIGILAKNILEVTSSEFFLKPLALNGFERLALAEQSLTAFFNEDLEKSKILIRDAGIKPQ